MTQKEPSELEQISIVVILRRVADAGGALTIHPEGDLDAYEMYEEWGTGLWELEPADGGQHQVDPGEAFIISISPAGWELLALLDTAKREERRVLAV